MKKILFYMIHDFDLRSGGHTVQYQFAKILFDAGLDVKVRAPNKIINVIFNNYLDEDKIDSENTVVIYAENIENNPIDAKYIIRWILAPLGMNSPNNTYKTWGCYDLVYYFNNEIRFNHFLLNNIYKLLNIFYISPIIKTININPREGWCFTKRKTKYHKNVKYVHPPNSFEITREHNQEDYVKYFNNYKYFISYDPVTFMSVIAALCGCISIIKKIDGVDKINWLNNTPYSQYLNELNITNLYGIAYGKEELEFATNTIHLAKEQWNIIQKYMENKNINFFINEITSLENGVNMNNTVKNNYINYKIKNYTIKNYKIKN